MRDVCARRGRARGRLRAAEVGSAAARRRGSDDAQVRLMVRHAAGLVRASGLGALANHVLLPTSRQSQTRTASSRAARAVSGMLWQTGIVHLFNIQHYRGRLFGKQYSIPGTDAGPLKLYPRAYLENWKSVAPQHKKDKARCLMPNVKVKAVAEDFGRMH